MLWSEFNLLSEENEMYSLYGAAKLAEGLACGWVISMRGQALSMTQRSSRDALEA